MPMKSPGISTALDSQGYSQPKADDSYISISVATNNFSKYVWLTPLKSKRATELNEALQTISTTSSRKPKKLWSDHESGLYSESFQNFCNENNITLYSTQSELKAMIAERFIQTFKNKMWKKFTELGYHSLDYYGKAKYKDNIHWTELIEPMLNEYNYTVHSTIRETRIEASKLENSHLVRDIM